MTLPALKAPVVDDASNVADVRVIARPLKVMSPESPVEAPAVRRRVSTRAPDVIVMVSASMTSVAPAIRIVPEMVTRSMPSPPLMVSEVNGAAKSCVSKVALEPKLPASLSCPPTMLRVALSSSPVRVMTMTAAAAGMVIGSRPAYTSGMPSRTRRPEWGSVAADSTR